jgi:GNAT superfamily N-acetyltransferase
LTEAFAEKPRIEKLDASRDVAGFDCGSAPLNNFLTKFALGNQKSGSAQTYVALVADTVVGYYSVTFGEVAHEGAPERLAKGLPRHPIPVIILARLGVSLAWQGKGLGSGLLLDFFRRAVSAADVIGGRAAVVHAKDEGARAFYEHFGFKPLHGGSLKLFLMMKDIRK